ELGEFDQRVHAIEVRVHNRKPRQLVKLQEREGRTWNVKPVVAGERTDNGTRDGRLPAAELAGEGDEVAGPKRRRDVRGKAIRRVLVGQDDIPGGTRRVGGEHQPSSFGGLTGGRGIDGKHTSYNRTTAGLRIDRNCAAMERH